MPGRKEAELFCEKMLDAMHKMCVWPTEYKGVQRTENGDRDAIQEDIGECKRYVAVSGNIKAGKSTLLNQLLFPDMGKSVLPTDPTPETAKITMIESIPDSDPEYFEVEFYSKDEWNDVNSQYKLEKSYDKFLRNIQFSESVGATPENWIGHPPEKYYDFAKLAEFAACHDKTKKELQGVVRGKFVPYVRKLRIFCHSKLLSHGTVIVDTPGLADPNVFNKNETKKWIERAIFVVYVHSVEDSPNLSADQKDFIQSYISGVDHGKFALVANFFDVDLNEVLDGEKDEWKDSDIVNEAKKIVDIIRREIPWCEEGNVFPLSAKEFRTDKRLDPLDFEGKITPFLTQPVNMRDFFSRATKTIFNTLVGRCDQLKRQKAERETFAKLMSESLEENQKELQKLEQDEASWKSDISGLEEKKKEDVKEHILSVNTTIKKVKGKIEDSIVTGLEACVRTGELAASIERIVNRTLDDHFAPFHERAYRDMINFRNASVGDEFRRDLVNFYNMYLGSSSAVPLQIYAVDKCQVDFCELEAEIFNDNLKEEWASLADDVDSFWSFYRTNLAKAKSGVVKILENHIYGERDSILKSHYIKPYEDMLEYVINQINVFREMHGRLRDSLQEAIEQKKNEIGVKYNKEVVAAKIQEMANDISQLEGFIKEWLQKRDILFSQLS